MGGTVWNDEGDEHKRACWIQLEYQYEHHFLHSLWICDGRFHCFGNISGVGTKWEHFWQHFFCEVSGQFYTEKIDPNPISSAVLMPPVMAYMSPFVALLGMVL